MYFYTQGLNMSIYYNNFDILAVYVDANDIYLVHVDKSGKIKDELAS